MPSPPRKTSQPETPLQESLPQETISSLYRGAAKALREAGINSPELDARLLICAAGDLSHSHFVADPGHVLATGARERFDAFVERRLRREPVSRILGSREFWGRDFLLSSETLDPRPDSETLVQAVLELCRMQPTGGRPARVLDMGTGTGVLLLSLLAELKGASGLGTDISEDALRTATANAGRLGLADRAEFALKSWHSGLEGPFDIIVANPPYIPSREIPALEPEVSAYDPQRALDGGADGLDCYRDIFRGLDRIMGGNCILAFEVGQDQADSVAGLMADAGLTATGEIPRYWKDLAGIVRCLTLAARPQKGVGNSNRSG